ncbi:MAG: PAS domain S-box protein [Methanoculleus sp.]|nr:PAS domain S-box protein [Methanoculleus sp.]
MISILYVDDEPDLLELARLFLERTGEFQVATSTSAEEALSSPVIRSYDAVISDYQMPGMNGIAFLKTIREQFGDVPFILFTGKGREEVVIEAINNGADFYVQKGGEPRALFAELAHKVRQAVRRKRAEVSLAEQEQRYHDLQNANDLIQSVAPDGHFLFVNKKWLDTLGYTAEELPNLTIFDVIHEESIDHCMETFRRVMAGENMGIIDAVFKTRDGRKVYVEGMANCKIVDGECRYTRGIFKDVTDRKQVEAELAESHDYLHQIYLSVQSGIVIIDAKTHEILDLNPAAARMIGTTRDRIVNTICHQFICPAERGRCPITDLHQEVDNSERTLLTAGGEPIDIIKSVAPFHLNGRECLLEAFLDNTERKKAADELHAAYARVTVAEEELRENYDLLGQKEQTLRESAEIFRAVVEQSNEGIAIVDFTGRLLYANHRAAEIVESAEDLDPAGGINVLDFVSPDFRESAAGDFNRVVRGHDRFLVNYRIVTLKDREKWLECIGRTISLKGSPAMLISFRDTTERMQAEKELRDSEYKFATVFKSNPVPLTLTSASGGVFIDVNDAFLHRTGYTREEVIGKTAGGMNLFVDTGENDRFVSLLREKHVVQGMELRCRNKAGEIRTCRFSSSIVLINGVPHILTTVEDITDRKRAQEAIRESGERYRLILENANDGILVNEFTPRGPGRFIDVNESACRILGMTPEELQGVSLIDLDTPDMQKRVPGIMQGLVRDRHAIFEIRYRRRDNQEKIIDVSVSLFDLNGKPTMLSVVRDTTDLRAAESALNALITGMVGTTGRKSLDRITESLSAWLGADCVMIGEITPDRERVRLLSMLLDGEKVLDYSYSLKGTPCENTAGTGFCVYSDNVARLFPDSRDLREFKIRGYVGTALRNAAGQVIGILCILSRTPLNLPSSTRGILEIIAAKAAAEIGRMNALEALSESEEKFRALVEHSLDGTLILDPEGTILFANPAAGRIIEIEDPGEVIGRRNVMEFIAPVSRDDVIRDFGEVAKGVDGYLACYRILTLHQEERWVESIGRSILFMGAPSILISLRDVTERQRAEEMIRQNEEKFRTVFENSPYPIAISSIPDSKFLDVNAALLTASGYSKEEILGRNPMELGMISPVDAARLLAHRLIEGKIENVPLALTASGGRRVHVLFSTIPITIDGRPAVVTVAAETTNLKRVEEELLRKNTELTAAEEELRANYEMLLKQEQELSASEARYRTLFENMLSGFTRCRMIYDEAGNPEDYIYLQTNRAFLRLLDRDDVTGKRATDVIPGIKSIHPELFEIYGRVARTGTPEVFELYFKPIRKWLKVATYSPKEGCFAVVLEDFTGRKQAEEALQKSEELLELVMNGVPPLISYLDPELRFVYINKAHAAWYGRPGDDLIGKSIKELLPEGMFPRISSYYRTALDGREITFENLNRDREGREHIFAVHLVPHILEGRVAGIFSALHDITERKRIEEALKESEARFHSMFERHGSIMLLIEPESGKILDANLAAEEFYGRAKNELCSLSMPDLNALPSEVGSAEQTAAGMKGTSIISPHRARGGETRIVEVHSSPISVKGRTVLFSIINDITERQRAEDALYQANRKLNLLSGITRHDINNQLQILNGYAMQLEEINHDPSFDGYLSCIVTASSRITSMIQFAREYEEVGVHLPVWQDLRTLVSDAGRSANLGRVALKDDLPLRTEVFADPLIRKVFFNLIDNALRHGGKATTIRFAYEPRDGSRVVVCEDDGDGVARELKERIFDPGFGNNTGFGLSLSREVLDITRITIKETGEAGRGARFEISIPEGQWRVRPE